MKSHRKLFYHLPECAAPPEAVAAKGAEYEHNPSQRKWTPGLPSPNSEPGA